MTQLTLVLRSRAFFVLLYCLFLWSLAGALVRTPSMRISIPNLVQNFAPALMIGTAALGYWLYMTQIRGSGVTASWERPSLSPKLLLLLLLISSLGAIFVAFTGNRISSAAGIMEVMLYILGLIAVAILSVLKPFLGICALLLTFPVALLLHLDLRYQGWSDHFGYVVMNPEILLVLVAFLSMQVGFLARKETLVRTRLDIPIAVFLLGSLIALFNSPDFILSSRTVFAGIFVPVLSYYLVVNGLRTPRELVVAVAALLLSFFVMGSYSLMAFQRGVPIEVLVSGGERLALFFHSPALFAPLLALVLPLPLVLSSSSALPLKLRFALAVLSAILFAVLVFTFTRGAWVGFSLAVVILLILSGEMRRLFLRISPFLVVGLLAWGGLFSQIFWARTESLDAFFQSTSWTDRLATWQTSWQMIVDNPLTGVGPGMFENFYEKYAIVDLGYNLGVAHNMFLQLAADSGLLTAVGLFSMISVALGANYNLLRRYGRSFLGSLSLGLLAGVVAYTVSRAFVASMLAHTTADLQTFYSGHTVYLFMFLGLTSVIHRLANNGAGRLE